MQMRKRVLVLMVFVLLIGCMGLTGCSQKKTAEEPAANQQVPPPAKQRFQ
jgi:ABC-type oligopeptide transport system substrate-binding subunit